MKTWGAIFWDKNKIDPGDFPLPFLEGDDRVTSGVGNPYCLQLSFFSAELRIFVLLHSRSSSDERSDSTAVLFSASIISMPGLE
jgi:hypothetical protein